MNVNLNGDFVCGEDLLCKLLIEIQCCALLADSNRAVFGLERYINILRTERRLGVAHCAQDTAPVCVRTEHGSLDKIRADNRLCQTLGGLLAARILDRAGHELGRALAVRCDLTCQTGIDLVQRLAERLIILVLPVDQFIACQTVRQNDAHIIGRGIAVNRYTVVGLFHVLLKCISQHFVRDRAVGRDEGQHGAHVRMDHAAALADAADAAGLAADRKLDRRSLGTGIGGHDGTVCLFRSVVRKNDFGQMLLDALNIDALADNAGGRYRNILFVHAEKVCRSLRHAARVLHAVRCAGICVAGVCNDRTSHAVFQMLHGNIDRSRLYAVHRVGRRSVALAFAENDRGIIVRAARLDAAAHTARLETLCGANAAVNDLHSSSSPFQSVRPVVSSRPSMIFMFCTAAPDAPFPRLSNSAVTIVCSSWPQTISRRLSRPAIVFA